MPTKKPTKKPVVKKKKVMQVRLNPPPSVEEQIEERVAEWRNRAENAEARLDIIERENAGEDDGSIAADHGGEGHESHPAVKSTRELRALLAGAQARVTALTKDLEAATEPAPGPNTAAV